MFNARYGLSFAANNQGASTEAQEKFQDVWDFTCDSAALAGNTLVAAKGLYVVDELIGLETPIVHAWLDESQAGERHQ